MDIATLAKDVTRFLPPFLPYLLKAGEKTAEEAGKELGGDAWECARGLWHRLRPQIEAKPTAREAVTNAAAAPQDGDAQAALRLQLRKLLAEDEDLAREIGRQWAAAQAAGVTIIASGERSVAAQNITGSAVVTGNRNTVQSGKYNVKIDKASGLAIGDQSTPPQQSPKGITMIPVDSSMLHSVGYDEQTRCLQVVFNTGQMYCYKDVPPEVFQDLLQAESKGQYMRACIIDVY